MSTLSFIEKLRQSVPEVEALYLEHLQDNKELLPHVLMGDITRLAEETLARSVNGSYRAGEVLSRLLKILEEGIRRDDATRELIMASFLENLDRASPHFAQLKSRLGNALGRALESQGDAFGEP